MLLSLQLHCREVGLMVDVDRNDQQDRCADANKQSRTFTFCEGAAGSG